MTAAWSAVELRLVAEATELEIAVSLDGGAVRPWMPIWVVCAKHQVFVRSWYRRDTGWFGAALRSRRARVRVPGLEVDVTVTDVGARSADVTARVDAAYLGKYGGGADSMVTSAAAATTLLLARSR